MAEVKVRSRASVKGTMYAWHGHVYYTCERYKSILYDDTKHAEAAFKKRFPNGSIIGPVEEKDPVNYWPK